MNQRVIIVAIQFGLVEHTRPVGRRALRVISGLWGVFHKNEFSIRGARVLTGRRRKHHSFSRLRSQLAHRTTS